MHLNQDSRLVMCTTLETQRHRGEGEAKGQVREQQKKEEKQKRLEEL